MTNKMLIPEDQVINLLATSKIKNKDMQAALILVLSKGYSYEQAAKTVGLTGFQILGRRARDIRQRYVEKECPDGWKALQAFYPPDLEADVDALLSKIKLEKAKIFTK